MIVCRFPVMIDCFQRILYTNTTTQQHNESDYDLAVVCGIKGTNYSLVIMPRRKQTNRAKALAKMLETATPEQVSKQL